MYFSHIFLYILRNINLLLINLPNLQSLQIRKSNVKHECEHVWQNRPDFVGSFVLCIQTKLQQPNTNWEESLYDIGRTRKLLLYADLSKKIGNFLQNTMGQKSIMKEPFLL